MILYFLVIYTCTASQPQDYAGAHSILLLAVIRYLSPQPGVLYTLVAPEQIGARVPTLPRQHAHKLVCVGCVCLPDLTLATMEVWKTVHGFGGL